MELLFGPQRFGEALRGEQLDGSRTGPWPYVYDATQAGIYWQPGTGSIETFKRYLAFYALTSSWWDAGRAAGNALMIALFGIPVLRLLRRFGARFTFEGREARW